MFHSSELNSPRNGLTPAILLKCPLLLKEAVLQGSWIQIWAFSLILFPSPSVLLAGLDLAWLCRTQG